MLDRFEHVFVEPVVERDLEGMHFLGQPRKAAPVESGDHEDARQHSQVQRRLEIPHEGFDELYYVHIDEESGFVVEKWRDEVG